MAVQIKRRIGASWVPVNTYVRINGQWVYVGILGSSADELLLILPNNSTNVNLQTQFDLSFGAGSWSSSKRKRVLINSGFIIGSTDPSIPAITVSSGLGNSVKIENFGSIQGAGGNLNSGQGGTAIIANSVVTIDNQGSIYGGGGGGGQGGTGGQGNYAVQTTTTFCGPNAPACPAGYYEVNAYQGGCCQTFNFCCGLFNCACVGCSNTQKYRVCETILISNGGIGGNGGVGQGYNQSATGGLGGQPSPVPNAGAGGTGGSGGAFGSSGIPGNPGTNGNVSIGTQGGPAGLAGFYIQNDGNVIWSNGNRGTVLGRQG